MEEPMMSNNNTVVVPARVISQVREGIEVVARDVAEAIDYSGGRGELFGARDRLGGVCALLDCLDRMQREDAAGVEVDTGEHGATLAAAVDVMCLVLQRAVGDLSEDDPVWLDREAECRLMVELQESVGSVLGRPGVVVVPGDVVVGLREGLFSELAHFVGDLDQVVVRPAHMREGAWVEPVARFDRARAVLDLIGWENRDPEVDVEVDMRWYGQATRDALGMELDSMRHLAEAEEGQECERAMASAGIIERFLAGLDG
jgi:hypothetical protein